MRSNHPKAFNTQGKTTVTAPFAMAALAYAKKFGWPVFPTWLIKRHNGHVDKVPCIKDWPNTASTDPANRAMGAKMARGGH